MFGHVPDYNDLLDIEEAREQGRLDRLPECCECGEPIQDEDCYEINDCLVCPDCLERNHKKETAYYVD